MVLSVCVSIERVKIYVGGDMYVAGVGMTQSGSGGCHTEYPSALARGRGSKNTFPSTSTKLRVTPVSLPMSLLPVLMTKPPL